VGSIRPAGHERVKKELYIKLVIYKVYSHTFQKKKKNFSSVLQAGKYQPF
jgi:hypothetical protein